MSTPLRPTAPLLGLAALAGGCWGTSCLRAGTAISTPAGPRPVESLRVGDTVWAWDLAEGRRQARRVTAVHGGETTVWLHLRTVGGGELVLTGAHPVWVVGPAEWRRAEHVAPGDVLMDEAGQPRVVVAVSREEGPLAPVYNLGVEVDENYFAGGILVHNKMIGIKPGRVEPYVSIHEPAADDLLYAHQTIEAEGKLHNPDAQPLPSRLRWAMDDGTECVEELVDEGQTELVSTCELTLSPALGRITLLAEDVDSSGYTEFLSTDWVDVDVLPNERPLASIQLPAEGATLEDRENIVLQVFIVDADEGPAELEVVWTSDVDGELAVVDGAVDAEGLWAGVVALSAGDHLLTVVVTDEHGVAAEDTVGVSVR